MWKWRKVKNSSFILQHLTIHIVQILEAEQVSGGQLLQLVTEMRRSLVGGSQPQRTTWLNHRALGAAETAFRDCLDATEDEVKLSQEP